MTGRLHIRVWVQMFFPNLPEWGWGQGWATAAPGRAAPSILVALCHMYLWGQQAGITASQGNKEELGQKDNQRDSSVPWGHPAVPQPGRVPDGDERERSELCPSTQGSATSMAAPSLPVEGQLFCSANIFLLK